MRIRVLAAFGAALVAAVVAAVAVTAWAIRDDPAPQAAVRSPAVRTVLVSGHVVLTIGQFAWTDDDCAGKGGYDDIHTGASVTVTDPAGKVIALGELTTSFPEVNPNDPNRAISCELSFEIVGVPAGLGIYGVEVSHRGVVRRQESELAGLRLGF